MRLISSADQESYDAQQSGRTSEGFMRITPTPSNPHCAEIEAFSAAILTGTMPPASGGDGLRIQRILAACYKSSHTRQAIVIPEQPNSGLSEVNQDRLF